MWLARNGEEPTEENEVSERGFKFTRPGFASLLVALAGYCKWNVRSHFRDLVFFTCVGIFIVLLNRRVVIYFRPSLCCFCSRSSPFTVSLRSCCAVRLRDQLGMWTCGHDTSRQFGERSFTVAMTPPASLGRRSFTVSLRRSCMVRLRHPAGNGDLWS